MSRFAAFIATVLALLGTLLPTRSLSAETIMAIQGAGHISPLVGQTVATTGVVTAVAFNGFYVQDPAGDGEDRTSDGIFVFTSDAPDVGVGDEVALEGAVSEFVPGGPATGNLSTTELLQPDIAVRSSGNALPSPVIIGESGRVPPNVNVIDPAETDPPINLQDAADAAANPFNPAGPDGDGIDFFESLEAMRVTIEAPVAVSAVQTFSPFSSEFFTLPNDGNPDIVAPPEARTLRNGEVAGIALQPDPDNRGDQNPERVQVQLDGTLFPGEIPAVAVGAALGDITGVVGYDFGNYEVNATETFDVEPPPLEPEMTGLGSTPRRATVASYNVLNLSAVPEDDNQRRTIAAHIVKNLRRPDVVALQEIQDDNGDVDDPGNEDCEAAPDGVVDASKTLRALADAIREAGGPRYAFFDVAPEEGTSGGVPCGNIRNAFLYNPRRVRLIDFASLTPEVLSALGASNPTAFDDTRNPLAAAFAFRGRPFVVINNHLTSRSGSTPIFGGPQPFVQAGEDAREAQAQALHEVVRLLLALNDEASVIVLGDLNTFEWTDDLTEILPRGEAGGDPLLFNLVDSIKAGADDRDAAGAGGDEAYTFIFEGNSQVLDHFFVSEALREDAQFDVVHINVDFPSVDDTVGSDHDPIIARLELSSPQRSRHDFLAAALR
jgi:predicted extracellular nuclease